MRVHDRVEKLLSNARLRDSDKLLLLEFWEGEGLYLTDAQKQAFMNCTPAESITRARRSLRSKYPGSEKVEEERFNKFKEYLDEYGTPRLFNKEIY